MVNDIAVQEFVKAIKEEPQDTNKTYNATVSKVDGEGVVWVNIHGSEKETPTSSTSTEVKRGDSVTVNWRNNKLYIGGNYSNPSAGMETVAPSVNYVNELIDKDISVASINAATGYIGDLTADNITTENIKATNGYIQHLVADDITAEDISASSGYIKDLQADNITAEDIIADHETVGSLDANYAHITNGVIDNAKIGYADVNNLNAHYAEIDMANVNNAWIDHGAMKKAEVFDGNVFDLSGDKATIKRIDASKINVANLRADNLVVRRINGQPVVGGYTLIDSNSSGYSSKNPQALGWYEFVNAQWVLSTDTTVDMTKAYYQEGNEVSLYDQAYINALESDLQQQIDGAVETFTGSVVPTLTNWPYTDWYDTSVTPIHDERAKHVGDIYYVVNSAADENGYCYRFAYDNTTHAYSWVLIKDSDVTKALSDISELQEFESTTTSWMDETDEGLETIRTNHTALAGVVDKTVKESVQLWFTKANTTAPNKPTAEVTSTSTAGNAWRKVVPAYNASYPNYYYCWQFKFVDGSFGWSDVVRDIAMGETQGTSRDAKNTADAALPASTFTSFESTTFKDVKDTVTEHSATFTNMTSRLGMNSDGTGANTDIVAKESALETTVDGISTRVGKTETKLIGMYATSSTAEGTAAKVATITPALPSGATWELGTGTIITVKFTNANTAANPTLNVNSKGAKAIKTYANGTLTEVEYKWKAGSTFTFTYNGTNWLMQDSSASVRMNSAETSIIQNAEQIQSKASQSSVDSLSGRVSTAESTITQQATAIEAKVSKNGVIASINASVEEQGGSAVKISADKVNITGTAVFNAVNSDASAKAAMLNSEIEIGGRNKAALSYIWSRAGSTYTTNGVTFTNLGGGRFSAVGTATNVGDIWWCNASGTSTQLGTGGTYTYTIYLESGTMPSNIGLQVSEANSGGTWQRNNRSSGGATTYTFSTLAGNHPYHLGFWAVAANTAINITFRLKFEEGNKSTDWTPAPEDVQAEIDAKKSVHTLSTSYSYSYANLLTYSAEGYNGGAWAVSSTNGVKVGDTVRLKCTVSNMSNAPVYVVGTVTEVVNGTSLKMTSHGLDTTIIDGGNILTNSIGANQIAANAISIGKLDSSTQTKVNNGDSALTKVNYYNRTCLVGNSTNTQTKYWRKFASYTETRTTVDPYIIFDVMTSGDFASGKRFGRLKAHVRTSTPAGTVEANRTTLEWISRGEGIALTDFVLAYKATSGTDVKLELWCRCPRSWEGYRFNMVQEGDRTTASTSAMWTLHNSWTADGSESITSGYTQVTSTDIDAARTTATTYITHIDNNGIRVHPSSTENNSVVINSTGMEVFKGGTGSANSVAKYGDTSRVGKESGFHVVTNPSDITFKDGTNADIVKFGTRTINGYKYTDIDSGYSRIGLKEGDDYSDSYVSLSVFQQGSSEEHGWSAYLDGSDGFEVRNNYTYEGTTINDEVDTSRVNCADINVRERIWSSTGVEDVERHFGTDVITGQKNDGTAQGYIFQWKSGNVTSNPSGLINLSSAFGIDYNNAAGITVNCVTSNYKVSGVTAWNGAWYGILSQFNSAAVVPNTTVNLVVSWFRGWSPNS